MFSSSLITGNNEADEQMALYSQLFPSNYAHQITQQPGGETAASEPAKPRRRRRKGKGGELSGPEAAEAAAAAARKRKLTEEQVIRLEVNFGNEHKLDSERKDRLAAELGLDPRQVAVWFQNRRARWKNKKLEEEYSSLKKQHDSVVVEKCCLESEVLRLKEQLNEAEREIQRLAERAEGGSSHSPSSSLSMEGTMEPPFLAEFGAVQDSGYGEFYAPVDNYIQGMEWMNLYL